MLLRKRLAADARGCSQGVNGLQVRPLRTRRWVSRQKQHLPPDEHRWTPVL